MRVKDTYDKFSEWTIHPSPWTPPLLLAFFSSQMCQNLRFSSPAPVTSTTPFSDKAEKSTRASCASLISKIFAFGPAPVPPLPVRHQGEPDGGVCLACSRSPELMAHKLLPVTSPGHACHMSTCPVRMQPCAIRYIIDRDTGIR